VNGKATGGLVQHGFCKSGGNCFVWSIFFIFDFSLRL